MDDSFNDGFMNSPRNNGLDKDSEHSFVFCGDNAQNFSGIINGNDLTKLKSSQTDTKKIMTSIKTNKNKKKGVFGSDGSKKRAEMRKAKYTFGDLENATLTYINCFKRIDAKKSCVSRVCSPNKAIGLGYIICSLRNEMITLKNTSTNIDDIEKYIECLNFLLSEDENQKIRYKYITSECGYEIFRFLWEAIPFLDKYNAEHKVDIIDIKNILEDYISKFKDMVIYYGNSCCGSYNNDLKVNNSTFCQNVFSKLMFFLGEGRLSQNKKRRKLFELDNMTNDKRYSEFKRLADSFIECYPELKDVLEDKANINYAIFTGKKKKRSHKSCSPSNKKSTFGKIKFAINCCDTQHDNKNKIMSVVHNSNQKAVDIENEL